MRVFRFAFFLFIPVLLTWGEATNKGPKIGDAPPPLSISKLVFAPDGVFGGWQSLTGKVVVLEFWATWCGPCIQAIPHLNTLAKTFSTNQVQFIACTEENEAVVRQFLHKAPIDAWICLDTFGKTKDSYGVFGIPHTVLIGTDGKVAAITHPDHLEARHIQELIDHKPCSLPVIQPAENTRELLTEKADSPPIYEFSVKNFRDLTNPSGPTCSWGEPTNRCEIKGELATVESALNFICKRHGIDLKIEGTLPSGYYDFRFALPSEDRTLLRSLAFSTLHTVFHLNLSEAERMEDVYILTVISTNAPGLMKSSERGGGGQTSGGFKLKGTQIRAAIEYISDAVNRPVIDETSLKGLYDTKVQWEMSEAELLRTEVPLEIWQVLEQALKLNPRIDFSQIVFPPGLTNSVRASIPVRAFQELKKPAREQFLPRPEAVIQAVHNSLGLEMTPAKRKMKVLTVSND